MSLAGFTAGVVFLVFAVVILVAVSYLLPRTFGLPGLIAAHLNTVFSMFVILAGYHIWLDLPEEMPVAIEIAVVAGPLGMCFNFAMLPLSIWAMFRWRRLSPLSPRYEDGV